MSDEKNTETDVKSNKEELPKPNRKIQKRVMPFDIYFLILMKKRVDIKAHHKAPIKKYMENKGLTEATEEEFDLAMRIY